MALHPVLYDGKFVKNYLAEDCLLSCGMISQSLSMYLGDGVFDTFS